MNVGDSVRVKAGVLDPDLANDIGGWQGRVRSADGAKLILIEWDSVTLREMSMDLILRCENENLDWRCMALERCEVERVESRDTERDVATSAREIWSRAMDDPRFNMEG